MTHDLVAHPERLHLPAEGEGVVVALSGGLDSTVLLDMMGRLERGPVIAAHLDHGLRSESIDDTHHCRHLASAAGVPFETARADVAARAAATGAGVEAAGREARAEFLERVRRAHDCAWIATAHHLDDHVESVLMALGRGTGLAGLRGIAIERDRWIRPLRDLRRADLLAHARERGLQWREDRSNSDPERVRNRLRMDVMGPLESALGPGSFDRIAALGARAAEDLELLESFVDDQLDALRVANRGDGWVLDRAKWDAAPAALRRAMVRRVATRLFANTSHQRWNADHVSRVVCFIERAHAGQRWPLPGGGILAVERDRLILLARSDEQGIEVSETRFRKPGQLLSEFLPASGRECSFSEPDAAFVDASRVRPPFVLRTLRPGDRMQPHGMAGSKKLVKILSERGVPRERRDRQLVVADRDRIVWAVGVTTSDRVRIDAKTRWMWQLRVEGGGDVPPTASDA